MKKKVALFFDPDTEGGGQVLGFLGPFGKRKSEIVGQLILLWISDFGEVVPVEWLSQKSGGELSFIRPKLLDRKLPHPSPREGDAGSAAHLVHREEAAYDKDLIQAGLSSFLGGGGE